MYTKLQQAVDSMVRTVRENISGIRVIKALSKSEYEKQRFAKVNRDVVARDTKAGITMAVTNPVMNLFLNVGLTLVVIVGAFRVNAGSLPAGKNHRVSDLFHHHLKRHALDHPDVRHGTPRGAPPPGGSARC